MRQLYCHMFTTQKLSSSYFFICFARLHIKQLHYFIYITFKYIFIIQRIRKYSTTYPPDMILLIENNDFVILINENTLKSHFEKHFLFAGVDDWVDFPQYFHNKK